MAASRPASRSPRDIANVMQRLQGKGDKCQGHFFFQYALKFKHQLNSQSSLACIFIQFYEMTEKWCLSLMRFWTSSCYFKMLSSFCRKKTKTKPFFWFGVGDSVSLMVIQDPVGSLDLRPRCPSVTSDSTPLWQRPHKAFGTTAGRWLYAIVSVVYLSRLESPWRSRKSSSRMRPNLRGAKWCDKGSG